MKQVSGNAETNTPIARHPETDSVKFLSQMQSQICDVMHWISEMPSLSNFHEGKHFEQYQN